MKGLCLYQIKHRPLKSYYFFREFIVTHIKPFLSYKIISDVNVTSACLLQPPFLRVDRMIRRTSLGACNSRTQPMSRRFHGPIYFKASFPAKEVIIGFGLPERASVMKENGCFSCSNLPLKWQRQLKISPCLWLVTEVLGGCELVINSN